MAGYERLFDGGELDAFLRWIQQQAGELVQAIPRDQFLNARSEEIVDHIVDQAAPEPLTIFMDQAELIPHETSMDVSRSMVWNPYQHSGSMKVSATTLVISIPFTGDRRLWSFRPQTSPVEHPEAHIVGNELLAGRLELQSTQPADNSPENFKTWKTNILSILGRYLLSQRQGVERFNADLPAHVAYLVSQRRKRLQQTEGLQDLLGIPLRRNPDAPSVTPVQLTRRLVRPLPPPPKSGYQSEPGIEEPDYQHILSVIRHEGRTFETTPKTYAMHDEEELRDILLAHLNGHYQGAASGETFRAAGKTDIRIEDGTRAAFIAECKVWKGQKELLAAIDQLLSYLTWRDCKTAIVIFNKHNTKFSGIVDVIGKTFAEHPLNRGVTVSSESGEWQFQMTSAEDEGRQLKVHVFVFDLYVRRAV